MRRVASEDVGAGSASAGRRSRGLATIVAALGLLGSLGSPAPAAADRIAVRAEPRRLTWSLFRHVDALPDPSEDARIAAEISFPRPLQIERVGRRYRLPPFTITVALEPERTVVRRSAASSPDLLRHEQGHYDIVVLATRALARDLDSLTGSSPEELRRRAERLVEAHTDRARRLSALYDRETEGGADSRAQERWDAEIAVASRQPGAARLRGLPL